MIMGKSMNGGNRQLYIRADANSPIGDKWVQVTVFVKDKPHTVRVAGEQLREALNQPDLL